MLDTKKGLGGTRPRGAAWRSAARITVLLLPVALGFSALRMTIEGRRVWTLQGLVGLGEAAIVLAPFVYIVALLAGWLNRRD